MLVDNRHISILMPVYNAGAFLNQCIDSIIDQKHVNWELISIDDYSNDHSFEILQSYAEKDTRIKVYKNVNKGIIPALALAFSLSSGEFVTRMDADDIMPYDKLSSLLGLLESSGSGNIVTGKVKYFSDYDLGEGYLKYQNWLNEMCEQENHYEQIYKECVVPSACWMAFRSDLEAIGAFSESQYPEDYDLVFKFYLNDFKVRALKKILHLWRDHPSRASRNDPNYADQSFFDLKLQYFLKKDRKFHIPLFLWGAGKKGKSLAKLLISKNVEFRWVTNNAKKIGHFIYEKEILPLEKMKTLGARQVIVTIADQRFQSNKADLYIDFGISKNDLFEF